jgi:hypothetical protein
MEQRIEILANLIYLNPLELTEAKGKKVKVELYPEMKNEIPDKYLLIESMISKERFKEVLEFCKPILEGLSVFALFDILGGNLICIGYSEENLGFVYYFDFDFGIFKLDDSIAEFIGKICLDEPPK